VSDPKFGEVDLPGMPLRFSDYPHNIPLTTASLGEHNAAVLTELLGYSQERIDALYAEETLFSDPDT
jgi:crotonobetainyl-CoA:carnitine CoA-transferase CaiB-like acyl-CoA transferase